MDNLTVAQRRKNMQNIHSKDTLPERLIEKELKKKRFHFLRNYNKLIGKPDFVFVKKKIVLFIDSDFWHGHAGYFKIPKTNTPYWKNKILKNKERDRTVNKTLKLRGWKVIRLWERDIKSRFKISLAKLFSLLTKHRGRT